MTKPLFKARIWFMGFLVTVSVALAIAFPVYSFAQAILHVFMLANAIAMWLDRHDQ